MIDMALIINAPDALSHRELALLSATAMGRVELSCSSEPDAFVDDLAFSDQQTARRAVHTGLIEPGQSGPAGQRVPARITNYGLQVLRTAAS